MRWALIGLLLLVGCTQAPPARDAGEAPVESWESVDVSRLNARIDAAVLDGADWPSSPLLTTLELLGGDVGVGLLTIEERKNRGEGADTTIVVMLRDRLANDSIRGAWHRVTLHRLADSTWRLHEVRRAFRCWRGHHLESYSSRWCP